MTRRKRIKVVLSENIVLSANKSIVFEKVNNEEYNIPDRLRMIEYEVIDGNYHIKDIIEASFKDMPWFADNSHNVLINVSQLVYCK